MSTSLDGYVAGPQGEIDWMFRSRSDAGRRWVEELVGQAGLLAMGSRTYDEWAGFWPTASDPLAVPMNEIPKVVFTRNSSLKRHAGGTTPASQSWANAEVVSGDLTTEMKRLKQQPGKPILVQGGVGFAQSLVAAGLIDEYRLVVHPVVLGKGLSLFADLPAPLDLELRRTTLFPSGVTAHVYRPAG
jgi:dihydrofolate reductase